MVASLYDITVGELIEYLGRQSRAGLTGDDIRDVNRSPKNAAAEALFEALMQHKRNDLVHGFFTKPSQQLEKIREWNQAFGWDFSSGELLVAESIIPPWPQGSLSALVLVPYLADKQEKDGTITPGFIRTFHVLWSRARPEQRSNKLWGGYDMTRPSNLRLCDGIEHKPGLRWESIILDAHRGEKPSDPNKLPHAGILAAAALHPEWVKRMTGRNVPYVLIPGYEVKNGIDQPWSCVPVLSFDQDDQEIELGYRWCIQGLEWAVPVFA